MSPSVRAYGDQQVPAVPPSHARSSSIQLEAVEGDRTVQPTSDKIDRLSDTCAAAAAHPAKGTGSRPSCRSSKAERSRDRGSPAHSHAQTTFESFSAKEDKPDCTPAHAGFRNLTDIPCDSRKDPAVRRVPDLPSARPSHRASPLTVGSSIDSIGGETPLTRPTNQAIEIRPEELPSASRNGHCCQSEEDTHLTCLQPTPVSGPTQSLPGLQTETQPTRVGKTVPTTLSNSANDLSCHKAAASAGTRPKQIDNASVGNAPLPSPIVWANEVFAGKERATLGEVSSLIQEASNAARNDYDESSAVAWANGYCFPPQFIESDKACLRAAQLDFVSMVRRRLKTLAPNRLNRERVRDLRPDNPEITLLNELVEGMWVPLPVGFTPNGQDPPTPLRAAYVSVAPAVNKMLGDVVQQRLAFILPYEDAKRYVPRLHLCKAHWTKKKGKPSGRPLGDLTFVDGTPINTPEMSEAAAHHYGAILHPTIEDIAAMACEFWRKTLELDPTADWTLLRLWKMDLKGAYTLLSFRPEDVGLFAMLLTGNLVYFQIAGIFGWAGTPAAFQVVTRAVQWELRHRLQSATIMYVDDIIGVGMLPHIESDLAVTRATCTSLLGPTAVADDKTEVGRRIDVIGYDIDLDTQRILIARKNFLNTLHGFISCDIHGPMGLRTAQKLASWASRYGKICRVMRPFCGALNRLIAGRLDPHARFLISAEARIAIKCWQAMLCLVRYQESRFTRTLESFAPSIPATVAEFDASLTGAGMIWYHRENGAEVARGVSAIDITFLEFGTDSSFQNLSEFIGAILCVLGHVALGCSGRSIALRGDSVTALTWAITERPRGSIVTNASMVWTLLCVAADVDVRDITHIPGVDNDKCDQLSRRGQKPASSVVQHAAELGLSGAVEVDLGRDSSVTALLGLCDPRIPIDSDADFTHFWTAASEHIDSFILRHKPPTSPISLLFPPTSIATPPNLETDNLPL